MEVFSLLFSGFVQAMTITNLVWLTIGSALGTILGMLPGIGPSTGIALLIPLTFTMSPDTALVTMCAIYYGAMFGGSRSSILINVPGDGASVASCFDGYPMATQGRAEAALAISAIASFIGGMLSTIAFVAIAVPVARFALKFGPPEYFMLMCFALAATAAISKEAMLKGLLSMCLGLMIATVGIDPQSGAIRFTFGLTALQTGIDVVVVIIGVYGLGEVFQNMETIKSEAAIKIQSKFGRIWVTMAEFKRCLPAILRETPIGFFVGEIIGLAAPEAANNACSVGALIPMMTLGVPGSGTTAVMLGALMILGMQPGPLLFEQHADVAWTVIASMFIGNIVCAIINLPLASLLVRILAVPTKILYPAIVAVAFIGAYTINFSVVDFVVLVVLGLFGYFMKKFKVPTSPMILAVVVGASMEQSYRQSMMLADNDPSIFFRGTICWVLFFLTIFSIAWPFISDWRKKRKAAAA